jgi:FKBP-type peptidyl-prolyl cis-trans isomerase
MTRLQLLAALPTLTLAGAALAQPATQPAGAADVNASAQASATQPAADAATRQAPLPPDNLGGAPLTDRLSYSIGVDMARTFIEQGHDLEPDLVAEGLADVFGDAELRLTAEQMQQTGQEFQRLAMQQRVQEMQQAAQEAGQEGADYVGEYQQEDGVTTTDSGLNYKVLEEGEGDSPSATDTVTVHYTGTLPDGTVFDSSRQRGQPATFPLNQVIAGWTEGLQLMAPGARYEFVIPPNATLIFDVELIEVQGGE